MIELENSEQFFKTKLRREECHFYGQQIYNYLENFRPQDNQFTELIALNIELFNDFTPVSKLCLRFLLADKFWPKKQEFKVMKMGCQDLEILQEICKIVA